MTTRGTYERTLEIRDRNRASSQPTDPCPEDCSCGRHTNRGGGSRPCPDACGCGKHRRSPEHNARISASMKGKK